MFIYFHFRGMSYAFRESFDLEKFKSANVRIAA